MPARFALIALVALAAGASAQTPTLVAAHRAPVAVAADTSLPLAVTDARAAALLDAWVAGDLAPLVAATAPARHADAWRDFAAFRRAAVGAHGTAAGFDLLGTVQTGDARTTTARLAFADGAETVALRWAADGTLVTMVRAAR